MMKRKGVFMGQHSNSPEFSACGGRASPPRLPCYAGPRVREEAPSRQDLALRAPGVVAAVSGGLSPHLDHNSPCPAPLLQEKRFVGPLLGSDDCMGPFSSGAA